MKGYWNNDRRPTRRPSPPTAYFRTGDIGVFDEAGFLEDRRPQEGHDHRLGLQRLSERGRGGRSAACPGVAECACIGVPDDKTGEAVRLFVVKAPGANLSDGGPDRALPATTSPPTRCRRIVRFLDALPKSTVGKILRKDLRGLE